MEFKDYYATLGVTKAATEKEIKQAFRKLARKHPSRRQPGRQGGRGEVQGDQRGQRGARRSREAQEVRRARRQLADVRAGARRAAVRTRSAASGRGDPGGGAAGYRTMTPEEMEEMFGDANPFSDFFTTFFGGGDPAAGGDRGRAGSRRGAPAAGPRRRARDRADARGRLSRRDAAAGAASTTATRGPSTCASPPASPTARACASPAKASAAPAAPRPAICTCACGWRRTRCSSARAATCYVKVPVPVTTAVLGGEVEVPTLAGKPVAAEDSAADAERPGLPAQGLRHAGRRQAGRQGRPLRAASKCSCRRQLAAAEREHYEALAKLHGGAAKSTQRGVSDMNLNKFTEKAQEAVVAAQNLASELQSLRGRARAPARRAGRAAGRHRPVDPAQADSSTRRGWPPTRAALLEGAAAGVRRATCACRRA